MDLAEKMICSLFDEVINVKFDSFPRISYVDAMRDYGSDKPDLRIPFKLIDIKDLMSNVEFKVFNGPANDPHGRVVALKIPGGGSLSRKEIDTYTSFVNIYGAKGLAWIKVNNLSDGLKGLQSPILKFLPEEIISSLLDRLNPSDGDIIFFGADEEKIVNESMGSLRCKIAEDLNLYTCDWAPLWVVDFPMFEKE